LLLCRTSPVPPRPRGATSPQIQGSRPVIDADLLHNSGSPAQTAARRGHHNGGIGDPDTRLGHLSNSEGLVDERRPT